MHVKVKVVYKAFFERKYFAQKKKESIITFYYFANQWYGPRRDHRFFLLTR